MAAPLLIPLIGLGIDAISSFLGFSAQKKEAERAQAEQERFDKANRASASASTRLALQDLSARQLEEMIAAAKTQQEIQREADSMASTARVAASEAGVSGDSVEALIADIRQQESRSRENVAFNSSITSAQINREQQAVIARGVSQVNNVRTVEYNKPSILSPILQIGGATLNTIDTIRQRNAAIRAPLIQ